jgi:hypothetical protein
MQHLRRAMNNRSSRILWASMLGLVLVSAILALGGCGDTPSEGIHHSIDPLPDLPLRLGNTWVYSSTYYDTYQGERITATYFITETVVDAQLITPYFVSQIARETTVVTSSINLNDLRPGCDGYYLNGTGGIVTYWYIISGTHVYRQSGELDLSRVESSWLEYVFPLSNDARWYPDGEQRKRFLDISTGPSSGIRGARGPIVRRVPAGEFESCFDVWTVYLSGGTESWFCVGVGLVGNEYAHQGTPYGHRTMLVKYWLQSP